MKHLLAVALEAEMARLYHAGVHRPHGHLVHLAAVHGKIVGRAGGGAGRIEAHRLQPRVAFRPHAGLLVVLPLEEVHLRERGGKSAERAAEGRGIHFQPALAVEAHRHHQPVRFALRHGEASQRAAARGQPRGGGVKEQHRVQVGGREVETGEMVYFHNLPPALSAAPASSEPSQSGMNKPARTTQANRAAAGSSRPGSST